MPGIQNVNIRLPPSQVQHKDSANCFNNKFNEINSQNEVRYKFLYVLVIY